MNVKAVLHVSQVNSECFHFTSHVMTLTRTIAQFDSYQNELCEVEVGILLESASVCVGRSWLVG